MQDWRDAVWRAVPEGAEPERFAARRAFLLDHVAAGERVLDLGCGDGAFAAELLGAGCAVTMADVAEEALRRARARAPGAEAVALAEGAPLPFDEDAFDVVWAGEVLEHVADVVGLLAEVRRVLRWGGRLLVTTPWHGRARSSPPTRHFDPRADHLRFFSARTLRAVLADAGFADACGARARAARAALRGCARSPRACAALLRAAGLQVGADRLRRARVEVQRRADGRERLRLAALAELELGQRQPGRRVGGLHAHRLLQRAARARRVAGGALDRRLLEERVDRQRVGPLGVGRSARAPGRSGRPRRVPSASEPSATERWGCHDAQAATTPTATAATASPIRHGSRTASARRRAPHDRLVGGPAAGEPARAQQREHGVAGHEPGPVDERVHAEDDADGQQRGHPDALGRPRRAPAPRPRARPCARPPPARPRAARARRARPTRPRSASVCTT